MDFIFMVLFDFIHHRIQKRQANGVSAVPVVVATGIGLKLMGQSYFVQRIRKTGIKWISCFFIPGSAIKVNG